METTKTPSPVSSLDECSLDRRSALTALGAVGAAAMTPSFARAAGRPPDRRDDDAAFYHHLMLSWIALKLAFAEPDAWTADTKRWILSEEAWIGPCPTGGAGKPNPKPPCPGDPGFLENLSSVLMGSGVARDTRPKFLVDDRGDDDTAFYSQLILSWILLKSTFVKPVPAASDSTRWILSEAAWIGPCPTGGAGKPNPKPPCPGDPGAIREFTRQLLKPSVPREMMPEFLRAEPPGR